MAVSLWLTVEPFNLVCGYAADSRRSLEGNSKDVASERQSLSAKCCGKAALRWNATV
jgi:hypothetical protein